MKKISGMEQLLAKEARTRWRMIKDRFIVRQDAPTDDVFEKTLQEFGTMYLKPMARRDKKST